ncbi:MAG: hypothetical protein OEW15_16000 [Nitrospirota bacterium]|nr:hypothetical protein [Nitrospirota bacterium]
MVWSGDAFYDWQSKKFTIAPSGTIVGSAIRTDLSDWLDHDGEIPKIGEGTGVGFMNGVLVYSQKWNPIQDPEVPDLEGIGTVSFSKQG